MVLINQHHRNPSCGNLRRLHWTLALCVLCGGKGTAPGCAHSVGAQRYQARDESLPTLTGRLKADWIHLPVDDVLALFPTVREGICMGVFRQKAAATWFRPRPTKLQVTVLIPGPLSVDDWLDKLGTLSHAWPQPHQLRSLQVTRVSAQAFEAARVSAAVKHLWPGLRPQWTTIYSTLRLEWPGVYDPSVLHGKFFDNVGQSDHTQDSQYQGKHWWWVFQRFRANQGVMARRLTISEPWGFGSWQANMVEFEDTLRLERRMAPIVSSAPSERWRRTDSQVPGCSGS